MEISGTRRWRGRTSSGIAVVPYCSTATSHLTMLLRRRSIKSVSRPPRKIKQMMWSPKDSLGLGVPGIYMIPCSCGLCHTGQTRRSVSIRRTEHQRELQWGNIEKSALGVSWLEYGAHHFLWRYKHFILIRKMGFKAYSRVIKNSASAS